MTSHARFPQAVLSQQFGEALGGRRVRSAVFTTFNFDPGFFELQVLPLLFSQSFSQVDKVRLLQLEDALRNVDHLAVYYDRRALSQDAEPARLDYRRIDVRRATGVFHPKLALLLVDEPRERGDDAGDPYQSLLVACLSANLSRAGWWENFECAHIEEVRERDRSSNRVPYRRDLLAVLRRIRACAAEGDDHRALDAVHAFLRHQAPSGQYVNASSGGRWYTRLFGGDGKLDLADWLAELRLGHRDWNLEVISPYFDVNGAEPLEKLTEAIKPLKTRVFLPRDADGSALGTADAYEAVSAPRRRGMGRVAPRDHPAFRRSFRRPARAAPRAREGISALAPGRGADVVLVGSVNCTSPAHRHGGAGNLEAAFLVDISDQNLPRRWWLKSLEHDTERFAEAAPTESDGLDDPPFGVSILYHWGEGRLAVRLEGKMALPLEVTDISGRSLFTIDRGETEEWTCCGPKGGGRGTQESRIEQLPGDPTR